MATDLFDELKRPRTIASRLLGATTGSTRVWLLTGGLGVIALVAGVAVVPAALPAEPPFELPWWLLLAGFFVVEARVIHLQIGRSAHSFSMSEIPLVAGLFLTPPPLFIVARVVGSGLALAVARKQRTVKLAFNVAQFALCSVMSVAIVHLAAQSDGSFGPGLWLAVFVATVVENLVGVVSVAAAISLADGTAQFRRVPEMLRIGLIVSLTNTSLALMGLAVLVADPYSAWLFAVPMATVALAYRAYISERRQHKSLELLYESTRILQRSPEVDTAIAALLEHARKMFRGDVAEILLLPPQEGGDILRSRVGPGPAMEVMVAVGPTILDPGLVQAVTERRALLVDAGQDGASDRLGRGRDQKALVAPLVGESTLIGAFRVADSLSEISTFGEDDLRLFETLANHTAVALENGRLEQSLEALGRLKEELHHQASHDPLTGLANRALFAQFAAARLESPDPQGRVPVALFIDLDDFKLVNDSLGHAAGDALLVAVGDRLRSVLRGSDVGARLGGDEFAVLLWDDPNLQVSVRVANRLTSALSPPFSLEGRDVTVRASIGVAAGRPGTETADVLLRNADLAMYSAKARGKGRVVVFDPSMHDAVMARAEMSSDMEHAIAAGEFRLQYQPIVEITTGRVVGVEALVRWQHPERGMIGPSDFIRVAEESDAILQIGRWVMSQACAQLRDWRSIVSDEFTVSVNIAARQLAQPDFVDEVLTIIREADVDPRCVVLEMTETSMLLDWQATSEKLEALKDAGIGISVDDFGTGYSSLSYLQRFPVTTLKIARDFVEVEGQDAESWELAGAIVALGRALHLQVIAEGVERRSQLGRLRALGCELAQGFYFARPLDPELIELVISRGGLLEPGDEEPDVPAPGPKAAASAG